MEVKLNIHQKVLIDSKMTICYNSIIEEYRCPKEITCCWAGYCVIELLIEYNNMQLKYHMNISPSYDAQIENRHFTLGSYKITALTIGTIGNDTINLKIEDIVDVTANRILDKNIINKIKVGDTFDVTVGQNASAGYTTTYLGVFDHNGDKTTKLHVIDVKRRGCEDRKPGCSIQKIYKYKAGKKGDYFILIRNGHEWDVNTITHINYSITVE